MLVAHTCVCPPQTVRNNNSSRFGKLITIKFKGGTIQGASIINYLLEKSRVVIQSKGERNYHIFYQLLAAVDADDKLKGELKLDGPDMYEYLNKSGLTSIPGLSDEKEFEDLNSAMNSLNFSDDEKSSIWKIVAAVLYFGNVKFEVDVKANAEDGSKIANPEILTRAAELIGCDGAAMEKSLCFRNVGNRSVILVSYSVEEACTMRDALAKTLYGELFQWLINKINSTIDTAEETSNIIGVLDIFGFECFLSNSFEQMCINYCNEKLQFHFNEHIFRLEQEMYKVEGVVVPSSDFADNQPTLDLIEAKGTGIFSMIDEEINVPKGSDQGFLAKSITRYEKHSNFEKPKPKACENARDCFGIVHYAGTVYYNCTNFLEKNKDSLHPDVMSTIRASSNTFIADEVLPKPPASTPGPARSGKGGSKKQTLGSQFKAQQQDLMKTLNETFPHFVRCMKPNKVLKGSVFEEDLMLAQLRYSGLLEVCRIRKLGFPVRRDFDEFFMRFKAISPSCKDLDELIAKLQADGKLPADQFQKGKSKVFMRNAIAGDLEVFREEAIVVHVMNVQNIARGFVWKIKMRSWHKILEAIRVAIAEKKEEALTAAIDQTAELPFHGVHLQLVKDAKKLQLRLVEEKEVNQLLVDAIAQRDLDVLYAAVKAANALVPPLSSAEYPALNDVAAIIAELEAELALKAELVKAIDSRDKTQLEALLAKAQEMGLECAETKQATAIKIRIEEEDEANENLKHAITDRDLKSLTAFLAKMDEMGLSTPEVAEGRKLEEQLLAEVAAKSAVTAAIAERKLMSIESSLKKAADLGLGDCDECKKGGELVEVLKKELAAIDALAAATSSRDLAAIEACIATAEGLKLNANVVKELANAISMKEQINKENDCKAILVAAAASGDAGGLSAALAKASELGITDGVELQSANAALSKLGAQNEMQSKLLNAGSLKRADVEKLISEAEGMGISGNEMASAKAALERAKEAEGLVASMEAETTFDGMSKLFADAERNGLGKLYASEMETAGAKLAKFKRLNDLEIGTESAIKSKDVDTLKALLAEAAAEGVTSGKIEASQKTCKALECEVELIEKIGAAIESKNIEDLKKLIAEADKKGIEGDKVQQARVLADREQMVADTRAKIETAIKTFDFALLNDTWEMVIQLGLTGPEVDEWTKQKESMGALDAAKKTLSATVKTSEVKVYSKGGIAEGDSKPLEVAVAEAKSKGVSLEDPALASAVELLENMGKQIGVQEQCLKALEGDNKKELAGALEAATDLKLKLESMDNIKIMIKEIKEHENMVLAEAGGVTEAPDMDEIDPEELESERENRREEAKNTKFRFWNFSQLRSPDDFAKGMLLNKKKIKEGMLKFQESLIPKSLLDMSKDNSKVAINVHRCMLGYMGDKQMSFPATLAHDILTKGLENPLVRDEIYMQIMKQLSHNPKPESIAKGWQLMCMAVSTFPPSDDFDKFLLNFVLNKIEGIGAVRNYAKYCLRTLEGMLTSGASGFVPSVEEIQAYKERPPILATVELVDGQILSEDLPVTPDLAVGKVTEICAHFLDLEDDRIGTLGLFVYDVPGEPSHNDGIERKPENPLIRDLPRTPRPLRSEDFLGDIIVQKARQGRNFKFVFKKKIFLDVSNGPSEDDQYRRLVYLQAEDEVITTGNLRIDDEDLLFKLCAMSIAYNFGEEYPADKESFFEAEGMSFIPEYWQEKMSEDEWADKLVAMGAGVSDMAPEEIEAQFVEAIRSLPFYGGNLFCVKLAYANSPNDEFQLPDLLTLCYREDGLHIFSDSYEHLYHFGYADIIRWGGSSRQFSLVIWEAESEQTFELMLHTAQAADMAAIILDYINAIMLSKEDDE